MLARRADGASMIILEKLMANEKKVSDEGGLADTAGNLAVLGEAEDKIEVPRQYKVLLHNDHYTTMEFVVMILRTVFHHPEPQAVAIMTSVHQQGSGVAGVFSREVAESRVDRVSRLAREHEHPLRCSMESA